MFFVRNFCKDVGTGRIRWKLIGPAWNVRDLDVTDAWWSLVAEATDCIIRIPRRKWDGSINCMKPIIRLIRETVRLMLFRETVAVYSENYSTGNYAL
jgi:hypothetical protein